MPVAVAGWPLVLQFHSTTAGHPCQAGGGWVVGFLLLSRRPNCLAAEPQTPAERCVAAPCRARQRERPEDAAGSCEGGGSARAGALGPWLLRRGSHAVAWKAKQAVQREQVRLAGFDVCRVAPALQIGSRTGATEGRGLCCKSLSDKRLTRSLPVLQELSDKIRKEAMSAAAAASRQVG